MITAMLVMERETKGAIRYREVGDNSKPIDPHEAKVGTLYIRKTAFDGDLIPKSISVTISPGRA